MNVDLDLLQYNTILPYKDRAIDFNKEVKVYRNLSKNGRLGFSILQNKKVVGHTKQLMLRDCVFVVNEKGRQRCLKTGQRNVHAFVVGKITHSGMGTDAASKENLPAFIKYSPFLGKGFYCDNLTIQRLYLKGAQVVKFKDLVVSGAYTF